MSKELVKYVAMAACAYILVHVGAHLLDDRAADALSMLAALAAIGTLLARHRQGPALCVAAGGVSVLFGGIKIAAHPNASDLASTASYVAAGLAAIVAGMVLMRRALTAARREPTA